MREFRKARRSRRWWERDRVKERARARKKAKERVSERERKREVYFIRATYMFYVNLLYVAHQQDV